MDDEEVERTITILGIDEAQTSQGQVSWVAPVARALLKARVGDEVPLPTPAGVRDAGSVGGAIPAKPGPI